MNEIKVSCQKEYDEAMPILKAAQEAVLKIDKTQLNIIKSYINPPNLVVMVLKACCLLYGYEENWENSKRYLLGDIRFLEKLIGKLLLFKSMMSLLLLKLGSSN